jgi:quercetin dioxygenase-like cupin family protein
LIEIEQPAAPIYSPRARFVSLSELHRFTLAEGVTAQPVFGEGAMLNLVELAPDARVPRHSHPHEQLGVVLRGELTLETVDGEHALRPMDAYALPGEIEHGAVAGPEGALVLDVFRPIREDYRPAVSAARSEPRTLAAGPRRATVRMQPCLPAKGLGHDEGHGRYDAAASIGQQH